MIQLNVFFMVLSSFAWQFLALTSSFLVLTLFSLHYPFATSFPMGGDSETHIAVATRISYIFSKPAEAWHGLRETWYPVSATTFSLFRILPVSWPTRYIWWMSTGYIGVGIMLAWIVYRLAGWQAAAWSMALWALTPIGINTHFEDGTGAQLWSLVWLLFFLERFISKSVWGVGLSFILSLLSHPLTGLIAVIVLISTLPTQWFFPEKNSRMLRLLTSFFAAFCLILGSYFLLFHSRQILPDFAQGYSTYLIDILRSSFGPAIIAAIPGLLFLYYRHRSSSLTYTILTSLTITIVLLAFNNHLGFSVWTNRFKTYLILLITLLGSTIFPLAFRSIFENKLIRLTAIIAFLIPLYLVTWQINTRVYAFYESPHHVQAKPSSSR